MQYEWDLEQLKTVMGWMQERFVASSSQEHQLDEYNRALKQLMFLDKRLVKMDEDVSIEEILLRIGNWIEGFEKKDTEVNNDVEMTEATAGSNAFFSSSTALTDNGNERTSDSAHLAKGTIGVRRNHKNEGDGPDNQTSFKRQKTN